MRNIDPDRRLYLWLDFETNGQRLQDSPNVTDPYKSPWPLEVAWVMTDDRFNRIGSFRKVSHVPLTVLPKIIDAAPPVVRDMHYANGLWEDVRKTTPDHTVHNIDTKMSSNIRMSIERYIDDLVEQKIYTEHEAFIDQKRPRLVLAGSGVSHFDSRWLRHFFPITWDWIDGYDHETKPTLDIGVVRRFLEQFTPVGTLVEKPESTIKHRALDDVYQIIDEAKRIQHLITRDHEISSDWQTNNLSGPDS